MKLPKEDLVSNNQIQLEDESKGQTPKAFLDSSDKIISIIDVIKNFLKYFNLPCTLKTFMEETKCQKMMDRATRNDFSKILNVGESKNQSLATMLEMFNSKLPGKMESER